MRLLLVVIAAVAALGSPARATGDPWDWVSSREAVGRAQLDACEPELDHGVLQYVPADQLAAAVARLEQTEVIALSEAEAERLSGADRPAALGPDARPYLVRAVRGAESGVFHLWFCGDSLRIDHFSMARSPPEPARQPLVVYLLRAPTHLFATLTIVQ